MAYNPRPFVMTPVSAGAPSAQDIDRLFTMSSALDTHPGPTDTELQTIKLAPEDPEPVVGKVEVETLRDLAVAASGESDDMQPVYEDAPGAAFDLIEEKALASSLGVTLQTVVSWRKKGSGPRYTMVGKHIFYQEKEVFAWLDRQTFESGQSAWPQG